MRKHLIIGTRGSRLALWQANYVKNLIEQEDPQYTVSLNIIKTKGDIFNNIALSQVGGKGLFVKELENALLENHCDLAVHSIKDMPAQLPEGLIIGCIPKRANPSDSFLSARYPTLMDLPLGAKVGTSSLRRQAQLLSMRPDLNILPLRGNIDTRLKHLTAGAYDGILLATAGLQRLGLTVNFEEELDPEKFIPAVGQGALGVECKEDNYELLVILSSLEDRLARVCVSAERAFLGALNGNCKIPIGGYATFKNQDDIELKGFLATPDASETLVSSIRGDASQSEELGLKLGADLLNNGGQNILDNLNCSE